MTTIEIEFGTAFAGYLRRKESEARKTAERKYDRRMPKRDAMIDGFVKAAIAVETQAERGRRSAIVAQKAAKPVVIPATKASAAKPTAQKCVVVGRLAVPPAPRAQAKRQPVAQKPAAKVPVTLTMPGEKQPGKRVYVPGEFDAFHSVPFEKAEFVRYESSELYHPAVRRAA